MKTTCLSATLLTLTLLLAIASAAAAGERPISFDAAVSMLDAVGVTTMDPVDNDLLLAVYTPAAGSKSRPEGAWRFAEPLQTYLTPGNAGSWETLADGSRLWRLRIASPGATSLNLGLARFEVPDGARLWLYDPSGSVVQGPYRRRDRTGEGGLWTALVPAAEAVVELHLPRGAVEADVVIHRVNHGFRDPIAVDGEDPLTKQGNCQNDVVCPEADPWRDQVRSVAWYTVEGFGTCTGSLVNNTSGDATPYFLSAEHCEITRQNASTMVIYWNYESPTCGRLAGGKLTDNQSGATFRAAYRPSDFVLVELNQRPRAKFNVYYAGWNAVNQAPARAIGIHHPNLDEKAISFNNRKLRPDGPTHWEIVWNDGTTEPGSSGSCIFDKDGLCVGTLTGGSSFCHDPQGPDYYGRMSVHFSGGGGQGNSLRPWLDPGNTGKKKQAGMDPAGGSGGGGGGGGGGGTCKATSTLMCLNNGRFGVSATFKDGNGNTRKAKPIRTLGNSGALYFFERENWEMLVNVVDGCDANNRFWVSVAAASTLEYEVKITDTVSGTTKKYGHAAGNLPRAVVDTNAFPTCP